jgi:CHAT domain-containing protein
LLASAARRSRELRGGALNPLPGTQIEAEVLSKLLQQQGWNVALYTRENALEERVKGVQIPRVLHLATHGFFESDQERKQKDLARGPGPKRFGITSLFVAVAAWACCQPLQNC